MSEALSERLDAAVAAIRKKAGSRWPGKGGPRPVGLILGSGLGAFADELEETVAIDYAAIPGFPLSTVEGHAGRLVLGRSEGVACAALQGRVHYYEGHDLATVVFPARVLVRLGASILIVTNAAGGIGEGLRPGSLMLLRDFVNLMGANPLRGANDPALGPRFPDMTRAFDPGLRRLARSVAVRMGLDLVDGVYAAVAGPSYETPAEIEMLARLGADAVGMSTVPETIAAHHLGARVLGLSCITNMAAGRSDQALSHDEVTETAGRVRGTFVALLRGILRAIGEGEAG